MTWREASLSLPSFGRTSLLAFYDEMEREVLSAVERGEVELPAVGEGYVLIVPDVSPGEAGDYGEAVGQ